MTDPIGVTQDAPGSGSASLVSVIIPTFNYAHFIENTIRSVSSQKYAHFEIIVIDDGSTDNTAKMLADREDIRYVYQWNQGLPAARNRGLREALGRYILFLDADDLLGPSSIASRVEMLDADENLRFVVGRSVTFRRFALLERLAFLHMEWVLPPWDAMDYALSYMNVAPVHAFLVRRNVLEEEKLQFDETLRACEDYDFWIKLALPSLAFQSEFPRGYVYYRKHASSMSQALRNQALHDAELCRRVLSYFQLSLGWFSGGARLSYLYPMFAGALVVARKLWEVDHERFASFLSDHVLVLARMLPETEPDGADPLKWLTYVYRSKDSLIKMASKDRSIDYGTFSMLQRRLPRRSTCFGLVIKAAKQRPGSAQRVARLIRLDFAYRLRSLQARILQPSGVGRMD